MKKKAKDLFLEYFIQFCNERGIQYRRYWIKGFIGRIFNRDSSARATLGGEIDQLPTMVDEFTRFVKENKVKRKEVVEFLDVLKVHKEEYLGRLGFLLVFGAMLAIGGKVVALSIEPGMTEVQKDNFGFAYYGVLGIFLIGALIERDGIVKRSSASAQLVIVIERWLKKKDKSSD